MKRYIYALFVSALLSLTACVTDDPFIDGTSAPMPNADRGLKIIGSVEDYDKVNVGTRAAGEGFSDSHITEMTMFIFKENGTMLQGYDANQSPISSAVNIQKSTPTFLINTSEYEGTGIIASMDVGVDIRYYKNTETDLGKCSIYIVANAYHQIKHLVDGNDSNGEIKSLTDLNNALLDIDATLSMPKNDDKDYIGFPMIGTHEGTFDLSYSRSGDNNDVAQIPMKKLYSKILFTMQINANQVVLGGPTPKFTINRAEVYNVPTKVRMGAYTADYIDNVGNAYQFEFVDGNPDTDDDKPFVLSGDDFSNQTIYHTTSKNITPGKNDPALIEFGFYMPEHRVTAGSDFGYPDHIPENLKQYYKPKGVEGQKATFVRIHGSYTDHNGLIKKVSFDIYLGQNHTDDFDVRRNQQLTNKLVITGITNHKDAYGENQTNVSVDHRVNVADQGYNLYMEREAILDAHFEVRPIDIELQWGSSVEIVIPTEAQQWIAMEDDRNARSGSNSNLYIDNTNKNRGVRKYFTTNLVSELNTANSGHILLQHSSCTGGTSKDTEYYRVWFYFDENYDVYDQFMKKGTSTDVKDGEVTYTVSSDQYRMSPVELYYSGNATDKPNTSGTPVQVINFQQWNLWRVWNTDGNRFYDIEHEEEYLNNYASNAGYGPEQNGMKWGLDGLQLSHIHDAAMMHVIDEGLISSVIKYFNLEDTYNDALKKLTTKPLYDFYLPRDISGDGYEIRPHSGLTFNKEIIHYLKSNYANNPKVTLDGVQLHQDVNSAIAYCYNKNKRSSDGSIDVDDIKWYLPAIDEIEEIAVGAYAEFNGVFQAQKYWSCQPSFEQRLLKIDLYYQPLKWHVANLEADYYIDDLDRARATSATINGIDQDGNYIYVPLNSGVPGSTGTQTGQCKATIFSGTSMNLDNNCTFTDFTDQQFIDSDNLGNLKRTEECRVRAVYRTGNGTKPSN